MAIDVFDTVNVTCGTMTVLDVDSVSGTPINNTFNAGAVGNGWSATSSAQFNNPCGWKSSTYLWMGPASTAPRTLATVPINVSCGGDICFELKYAQQSDPSPCEGPDLVGEGITLQYRASSISPWVDIDYFEPNQNGNLNAACANCGDFTAWATYCYPIPAAALTPITEFRWIQQASSASFNDHWGLDSVVITNNCAHVSHLWSTGDTTLQTTAFSLEDSTYWVRRVMNYTDTCYDSVRVAIREPDAFLSVVPDIGVCPGTDVELKVDSIQWLDPTVTYSKQWTPTNMVLDPTNDITSSEPIHNNTFFYHSISHPVYPECNGFDSVYVPITNLLEFDNVMIFPEYCSNQDGVVNVFVSGGTGQYWYDMGSSYDMSKIRNTLESGSHYINVVDSLTECSIDTTVFVPFDPGVKFDEFQHNAVSCPGFNDGKATVWASNNYGYMAYEWFNNTGSLVVHPSLFTIDSLKNLYAGDYTVIVSDQKCSDTVRFNIPQPDTLRIDVSGVSNLLCNVRDNILEPVVTGGTPGYELNWFDTVSPVYVIRGEEDTTVSVYAIDSRGCISETKHIPLQLPDPLQLHLGDTILCKFEKIALDPKAEGGVESYFYEWNTGWERDTLPLLNQVSNTYWVRVGDGCLYPVYDTASVDIFEYPKPYLLHDTVCLPSKVTLETNVAQTDYTWFIEGDTIMGTTNLLTIEGMEGERNVIYTFRTKDGCLVTGHDTLVAYATPNADFYWDTEEYYDSQYNNVVAFTSTSRDYETLRWIFPDATYRDGLIDHTFTNTGKQEVTLIASNAFCQDDTTQVIEIKPSGLVWIPNSFTPNRDLNNDVFKPALNSIVQEDTYVLRIFNRWGDIVFRTNDVDMGWDGKHKGELVPAGVYAYDLKVRTLTGERLNYSGQITVMH